MLDRSARPTRSFGSSERRARAHHVCTAPSSPPPRSFFYAIPHVPLPACDRARAQMKYGLLCLATAVLTLDIAAAAVPKQTELADGPIEQLAQIRETVNLATAKANAPLYNPKGSVQCFGSSCEHDARPESAKGQTGLQPGGISIHTESGTSSVTSSGSSSDSSSHQVSSPGVTSTTSTSTTRSSASATGATALVSGIVAAAVCMTL